MALWGQTGLGTRVAEGARMTRVMCNGVAEPSWGHTWPLGTHSWGRHPAREQTPVGGEHVQPRDTYCQGTCPCRLQAHPLVWEMALPGDTSLGGADTAKGHSDAEATHPRGTQAPLSLLWRDPHVPPPAWARSPWDCHPATSKTSIQLLGTSWQWGAPSLGSPCLWGGAVLGSQGSGQQDGGGRGHRGHRGWPPATSLPKRPMACARLGGAAWGHAPPLGQEGVKGLLQLCVQMCDMQMRPSGFYKAGTEAASPHSPGATPQVGATSRAAAAGRWGRGG